MICGIQGWRKLGTGGVGGHFLLLVFFDKINFLTTLLLKLGQIFDEVAKLGKSTQDAYNPGKWLIL